MLKHIMYLYILVTTAFRLGDVVFLMITQQELNLPVVCLVFIWMILALGLFVIIRRLGGKYLLREQVLYALMAIPLMIFNLLYIYFAVPVQLTTAESLAVGSVLDVLFCIIFLFYSVRQLRSQYLDVHQDAAKRGGAQDV